ncbi:photosynthetic complex assembly protein PuhC [Roseibaca sp. Y0-43]|uniref:photosynthetic complex assembly protein PuhC n=1 Tax=Roseibaca sp. Y0-43 TaxID=2816854 RepID=UPI001D0CB8CE|nr:photosynthetic complex assembly protein PuhC [Roseibaca sp. Y0-43]MCC1482183.1 photosynthetic complex assembly protein [Roseibaca sp. Y0-43]
MSSTDNSGFKPGFKRNDNNDMIPIGLIRAMFALVAVSLALVTYASVTGRQIAATPADAPIVEQWSLRMIGQDAQAVTVLREDGTVLADMDHGGFVTVIQNGLMTMRRRHGIDPSLPVDVIRFENGRLAAIDPLTDYRVELTVFGPENLAAFERMLAEY